MSCPGPKRERPHVHRKAGSLRSFAPGHVLERRLPPGHTRDNRESALKGGENSKDDIVPGNSAQSKLIHYVTRLVEDMEMPPAGKGEPLTSEQIGLLRKWVDDGARWPPGAESVKRDTQFSIT